MSKEKLKDDSIGETTNRQNRFAKCGNCMLPLMPNTE